jgi:hypothetical protein
MKTKLAKFLLKKSMENSDAAKAAKSRKRILSKADFD